MAMPFQDPRPDRTPSEQDYQQIDNSNYMEKPGLDWAGAEAILSSLRSRKLALSITRLPAAPDVEQATPLQLFGALVGVVRRKQGYNLNELATRAGLDPDDLLAIELGAATYEQVAAVLHPLGDALGEKYSELSRALAELALG